MLFIIIIIIIMMVCHDWLVYYRLELQEGP